jgi:hypothetical protein
MNTIMIRSRLTLLVEVLPGFLVQFGIAADADKRKKWADRGTIKVGF